MHSRTQKMMKEFGIDAGGTTITGPVGYMEFLEPEAHARLVLTDSGGVQEEACSLKISCVTLRENTGRPETIEAGANMLAGTDATRIIEATGRMLSVLKEWQNPYGDGKAGERIVGICQEKIE
jgi:UDP-N-acetylglucosamine 2-epimerase (non-hydrolysing)